MKLSAKLRLIGAIIIVLNLWLIGKYGLTGMPAILLMFGFAAGYEFLIVRPTLKKIDKEQ